MTNSNGELDINKWHYAFAGSKIWSTGKPVAVYRFVGERDRGGDGLLGKDQGPLKSVRMGLKTNGFQ